MRKIDFTKVSKAAARGALAYSVEPALASPFRSYDPNREYYAGNGGTDLAIFYPD